MKMATATLGIDSHKFPSQISDFNLTFSYSFHSKHRDNHTNKTQNLSGLNELHIFSSDSLLLH